MAQASGGSVAGVVRANRRSSSGLREIPAPRSMSAHEESAQRHVVEKLERMGRGSFVGGRWMEISRRRRDDFQRHGVGPVRSSTRAVTIGAQCRLEPTCQLVSKVHIQGQAIHRGHAGPPSAPDSAMPCHPEVEGGDHRAQVWADAGPISSPRPRMSGATRASRRRELVAYGDSDHAERGRYRRGVIRALSGGVSRLSEGPDVSDICYETQHRPAQCGGLCEVVDLLLVVGSAANSSNSNRLGVSSGGKARNAEATWWARWQLDSIPPWLPGLKDRSGWTRGRQSAPERTGGSMSSRHLRGAWQGRSRADGRLWREISEFRLGPMTLRKAIRAKTVVSVRLDRGRVVGIPLMQAGSNRNIRGPPGILAGR